MNKTDKRILIIDDAATVRMYHRSILEAEGFQVDEAMNGVEAIEKVLVNDYDLFLVDINMPKLDGYGFLIDMRGRDIRQAPAIMVSTESRANDCAKAYEAGANFYLVKPCKPEALLAYCNGLLGCLEAPVEKDSGGQP
ncbi:response regulator transcription factor [Pokkaliibacter sp. CJK22405]|uniref:response regulator transcription factor n=1 Tax=Pokkaliibacter sp. CJK22405 TaxID=3384615 RepID=UPI0039847AC9